MLIFLPRLGSSCTCSFSPSLPGSFHSTPVSAGPGAHTGRRHSAPTSQKAVCPPSFHFDFHSAILPARYLWFVVH